VLDINIKLQGDKLVIQNLAHLAAEMPKAVDRALVRAAIGIERAAHDYLSGAGGAGKSKRRDYEGFERKNWGAAGKSHYQTFRSYQGAGGYPVPVRTGHLRRSLAWLRPGTSKTGDSGTFSAGDHEVVIFDSAEYANAIHEGKGSSAKFGRRPYLQNALQLFNQGDRIRQIMEEEIGKEIEKR